MYPDSQYNTDRSLAHTLSLRISTPSMAPNLETYFKTLDSLAEDFIERLRAAVAIPSVSAEDDRRPDVVKVRTNGGRH